MNNPTCDLCGSTMKLTKSGRSSRRNQQGTAHRIRRFSCPDTTCGHSVTIHADGHRDRREPVYAIEDINRQFREERDARTPLTIDEIYPPLPKAGPEDELPF